MGRTEGKNGSLSAIRIKIHKEIILKKHKEEPEAMPKFLLAMCIFATVTVLPGTHAVP